MDRFSLAEVQLVLERASNKPLTLIPLAWQATYLIVFDDFVITPYATRMDAVHFVGARSSLNP